MAATLPLNALAGIGLVGHQVHPTPDAALAAALQEGFTEPDPGALRRLAASATR